MVWCLSPGTEAFQPPSPCAPPTTPSGALATPSAPAWLGLWRSLPLAPSPGSSALPCSSRSLFSVVSNLLLIFPLSLDFGYCVFEGLSFCFYYYYYFSIYLVTFIVSGALSWATVSPLCQAASDGSCLWGVRPFLPACSCSPL